MGTIEDELAATGVPMALPGDADWDEARRVWNAAVDRHPRAVMRCRDVDDVRSALAVVRRNGAPLAIRGGGHGFAGYATCDDGVVLDLAALRQLEPAELDAGDGAPVRVARLGPGLRWGEVTDTLAEHGLAAVGGHVSGVGVPGLLLGGGVGWLARRHGLACDNLVEATVVTADGEVVRAAADEHADLFWGLRGGGGNFGVVTSFTVRVHELSAVYAGLMLFPRAAVREVLAAVGRLNAEGGPDLGILAALVTAPPEPFVPEELQGRPCVLLGVLWIGPLEEGPERVAALRAAGPAVDLVAEGPFAVLQHLFDGFNGSVGFHMRSHLLGELSAEAIRTLIDETDDLPPGLSSVLLVPLGGAVAEVAVDATAFRGRLAAYNVEIAGAWAPGASPGDEGREAATAWAERCWRAMVPFAVGAEINHVVDEGPERVREAYGEETFARLAALKRRWDPENLFRLNENVPPA